MNVICERLAVLRKSPGRKGAARDIGKCGVGSGSIEQLDGVRVADFGGVPVGALCGEWCEVVPVFPRVEAGLRVDEVRPHACSDARLVLDALVASGRHELLRHACRDDGATA